MAQMVDSSGIFVFPSQYRLIVFDDSVFLFAVSKFNLMSSPSPVMHDLEIQPHQADSQDFLDPKSILAIMM